MKKFELTIIGLGLIGGSMAYALRGFRDCSITGYDADAEVLDLAVKRGAIDRAAASAEESVANADLVIFCSGPESIIENMRVCLPLCKSGAVVTDICGVKKPILDFIADCLPEHVDYVGIHPMAGRELSGFQNAEPELFRGAGFIIIPPQNANGDAVRLCADLCEYVGAGRIVVNSAEEHDDIIAYTSDLMHIAATALCIGYPRNMTMAHTAGAFRDCTRVANINADLWSELLTDNGANVLTHLNEHINNLTSFRDALESNDKNYIRDFLREACDNKKKIQTM